MKRATQQNSGRTILIGLLIGATLHCGSPRVSSDRTAALEDSGDSLDYGDIDGGEGGAHSFNMPAPGPTDCIKLSKLMTQNGRVIGFDLIRNRWIDMGPATPPPPSAPVPKGLPTGTICRYGLYAVLAAEVVVVAYLTYQLGAATWTRVNMDLAGMDQSRKLCKAALRNYKTSEDSCAKSGNIPCMQLMAQNFRDAYKKGNVCNP